MAPLPKKKHSTSRKRRKRAHIAISAATLVLCPQCRSPRPSHHACPVCGTYRGRGILAVGESGRRAPGRP